MKKGLRRETLSRISAVRRMAACPYSVSLMKKGLRPARVVDADRHAPSGTPYSVSLMKKGLRHEQLDRVLDRRRNDAPTAFP